jgi:hypothetical protein
LDTVLVKIFATFFGPLCSAAWKLIFMELFNGPGANGQSASRHVLHRRQLGEKTIRRKIFTFQKTVRSRDVDAGIENAKRRPWPKLLPGTDVMIFKNIFDKKMAKKLAFLTQNKAKLF